MTCVRVGRAWHGRAAAGIHVALERAVPKRGILTPTQLTGSKATRRQPQACYILKDVSASVTCHAVILVYTAMECHMCFTEVFAVYLLILSCLLPCSRLLLQL